MMSPRETMTRWWENLPPGDHPVWPLISKIVTGVIGIIGLFFLAPHLVSAGVHTEDIAGPAVGGAGALFARNIVRSFFGGKGA